MSTGTFKYVPAGCCYSKFANLSVYWRPANNKSFKQRRINDKTIVYHCHDRDLIIIKESMNNELVIGGDYNLVVFDVFDMRNNHIYEMDYFMSNYMKSSDSDYSFKNTKKNPNITLLSDSGGFQIIEGRTDFIDPVDVAHWYDKNTHAGMVLDIPSSRIREKDILKRTARIQRLNNELMLNVCKKAELINIVHGSSLDNRLYYHEQTKNDKIPRIAIGGMKNYPIHEIIYTTLSIFKEDSSYKQYHILGITRQATLLALAYASLVPGLNITTDSSSHVQTAKSGTYFLHTPKLTQLILNSKSVDSEDWILPCQCPVCSIMKYANVMSKNVSWVTSLYALHNAFVINKFCKYAVECARQGRDTMNPLASLVVSDKTVRRELTKAFDLVDEYLESSTVKSAYAGNRSPILTPMDWGDSNDFTKRVLAALKNMEKYHATQKNKIPSEQRKRNTR